MTKPLPSYFIARRLRRSRLVEAVAPAELKPALGNLVDAGLIGGFEEREDEVLVWGDLKSMECALDTANAQEEAPPQPGRRSDARGEYFQACRAYIETASFRALPPANKAIWRLHAAGLSHQQICGQLGVSPMKVRIAVKGARLAMNLPAAASSVGHGAGQGGRPRKQWKCEVNGCPTLPRANGVCPLHYLQRWRRNRRKIEAK